MPAIRMTKEQQKKLDAMLDKKATMKLPRLLIARPVADQIRKRFDKAFRTRKMEKHGEHDQSTHGNREGADRERIEASPELRGDVRRSFVRALNEGANPESVVTDADRARRNGNLSDADIKDVYGAVLNRVSSETGFRAKELDDKEKKQEGYNIGQAVYEFSHPGTGRMFHLPIREDRSDDVKAAVKEMREHKSRESVGRRPTLEERGRHEDPEYRLPQHEREDEKAAQTQDLSKYIRHEDGKWTVYSESGKRMGTYDSESAAKHRLQQIEYFKTKKSIMDGLRDAITKLGQRRID